MIVSVRVHLDRLARAFWLTLGLAFAASVEGCAQVPVENAKEVRCAGTSNHHDGDTFTCALGGTTAAFVVRVASVDAPETGQAYWRVARARLRELASQGCTVRCYKVDRYERRVCRLRTADGRDAADVLLSEGLAWYPEGYAHEDAPVDRARYQHLQAEARSAKLGIWSEPDPMPPRTCRELRRAGGSCR